MAIPRAFRTADKLRRADLKEAIKLDAECGDDEAEAAINIAKSGKIIAVSVGQHGYTTLLP